MLLDMYCTQQVYEDPHILSSGLRADCW